MEKKQMTKRYLTGTWSVVIMKGKWNDAVLIKTNCTQCNDIIGYYSNSGEPRENRQNIRCSKCLQKAINAIPSTHTMELSN